MDTKNVHKSTEDVIGEVAHREISLGEIIRALRKRNKLTMRELASAIGTSKENIYKYEHGKVTNIPLDKLESIAKALEVSPAYLTGWECNFNEIMTMSDYQTKFAELALKEVETPVNDRYLPGFLRSNMERTVELLAELIKACNG